MVSQHGQQCMARISIAATRAPLMRMISATPWCLPHHLTCRLDRGLPSSSVQWGPWASGLALSDPAILQRFERAGLAALSGGWGKGAGLWLERCILCRWPWVDGSYCSVSTHAGQTGLAVLQAALNRASPAACLVGASILWPKLLHSLPQVPGILADFAPSDKRTQHVDQVLPMGPASGLGPAATIPAVRRAAGPAVTATAQPAVAQASLLEQVTQVARSLLGTTPEPDQPLMEAGLDSLGELSVIVIADPREHLLHTNHCINKVYFKTLQSSAFAPKTVQERWSCATCCASTSS